MDTIKIRYRKKLLLPFLIIVILGIIAGNIYWIFYQKEQKYYYPILMVYLLIDMWFIRFANKVFPKVINDEPVITLSQYFIEIHEKETVLLNWNEISSIKIEQKDSNHFLKIISGDKKIDMDVSWLDKTPDELSALIFELYKKDEV